MNTDELKQWIEKKNFKKKLKKFAEKYKNKKVLIYGAGELTDIIFDNFDLSKINVSAVADMKFDVKDGLYRNIRGINPFYIDKNICDVVLILVFSHQNVADFLKTEIEDVKNKSIKVVDLFEQNFLEKLLSI